MAAGEKTPFICFTGRRNDRSGPTTMDRRVFERSWARMKIAPWAAATKVGEHLKLFISKDGHSRYLDSWFCAAQRARSAQLCAIGWNLRSAASPTVSAAPMKPKCSYVTSGATADAQCFAEHGAEDFARFLEKNIASAAVLPRAEECSAARISISTMPCCC